MFHRERLDSSKMAFIDRVQNRKQVSRFCLDHSRARNGREIRKQLKQTCRTKQRKEKRLKHKVSGYKSQSKRRSIAGCRLLLRTLHPFQLSSELCQAQESYWRERNVRTCISFPVTKAVVAGGVCEGKPFAISKYFAVSAARVPTDMKKSSNSKNLHILCENRL